MVPGASKRQWICSALWNFSSEVQLAAPRCQVESVDFKLCGGQMHFEVLGGRHVVATQKPH